MKKRIAKTVILFTIISLMMVSFSAQIYSAGGTSAVNTLIATTSTYSSTNNYLTVNVRFSDKLTPNVDGKLISNTTYVALRSFLNSIGGYNIKWSQKNKTATAISENYSIVAQINKCELNVNGNVILTIAENKLINNTTYVPIRPLANALGYDVSWKQSTMTVTLAQNVQEEGENVGQETFGTYDQYSARADSYYDHEDLYWLSRIISAEAQGESLEGKLAVGNVVMNRKSHDSYPDTIKEVIFDDKHGVQFTPVANGAVYKDPTKESIFAAKIILEGYRMNNEIIYFVDTKISPYSWVELNNTFVFKIGCHSFFK